MQFNWLKRAPIPVDLRKDIPLPSFILFCRAGEINPLDQITDRGIIKTIPPAVERESLLHVYG